MKYWLLLFFGITQNASIFAAKSSETKQTRYDHLNILMEDLQGLNWGNDETVCLKQILRIIQNVQNSTLWATWIWDSMQTPVGQLYGSRHNYGNYDECVEFPWEKVHSDMRTQYCLAHIQLSDVDSKLDQVDLFGDVKDYIRGKTKHHLEFNTLTWGVCTPAVCKPHSVSKFVRALFRQTHLGLAVDEPHISVSNCDVAGDIEEYRDFGYYFIWSLIVSAVLLSFLGTLLINYKGLDSKSTGFLYVEAFHIPKNVESLTRITDDDLQCLFGIRVFAFFVVIFIHAWVLPKSLGISNAVQLDKDYHEKPWVLSIINLEIVVDTFMFMSGLLLIKSLKVNGLKTFNPVKVIIKRYLRLLLPVILVILISLKSSNVPRGPARNGYLDKEMGACKENWWAVVLMVQNYVDIENMCYPVFWSVACDFHQAVIGTIGTWLFMRNRKLGRLLFLIGFTAAIILPATATLSNPELATIPSDFQSLNDYRKYFTGNYLYTATHFRLGSYFVGMAAGYLLTIYSPATHRNIINKKYSILSFGVLLAMFAGYFTVAYYIKVLDINILLLASYVALKRIFWALLITVLVILCEYGTLPLVPGFLSWSAWAPFSRLSYGIYLSHGAIILYWRMTTRSAIEYEFFHLALTTLGVIVASCIISLLVWTFYEEPLRIIVSLALRDRNKTNAAKAKEK